MRAPPPEKAKARSRLTDPRAGSRNRQPSLPPEHWTENGHGRGGSRAPRGRSRPASQTGAGLRADLVALVAGPVRAARLVLIASAWRADLAPRWAGRIRAAHFGDDRLLRAVGELSVGSAAALGRADIEQVERLLRSDGRWHDEAIRYALHEVELLASLVGDQDVDAALEALRGDP